MRWNEFIHTGQSPWYWQAPRRLMLTGFSMGTFVLKITYAWEPKHSLVSLVYFAQMAQSLMKLINVRVIVSYVLVCSQIIIKINILVDMYTDSLSFKFYEDPFTGC